MACRTINAMAEAEPPKEKTITMSPINVENAPGVRSLTPSEIATAVRSHREFAGMKQVTLAQLAGVTERTIQRLESGQRMDDQTLRDVAVALGLAGQSFVDPIPTGAKVTPSDAMPKGALQKYFSEMVAFDRWANEAVLNWLETHPEDTEMTRIFAHLIAENHPWLYVLRGADVPPEVNPQPNWTLAECRAQFGPTMDDLASFVADLDEPGFATVVHSSNPAGVIFENTTMEVLTNLLVHAEHHRGQIVSIIAKETGDYVPTVYMSYLRCRS